MYRKRGELKVLGQSYSFPPMMLRVHNSPTKAFWLKVKRRVIFVLSFAELKSLLVPYGSARSRSARSVSQLLHKDHLRQTCAE